MSSRGPARSALHKNEGECQARSIMPSRGYDGCLIARLWRRHETSMCGFAEGASLPACQNSRQARCSCNLVCSKRKSSVEVFGGAPGPGKPAFRSSSQAHRDPL